MAPCHIFCDADWLVFTKAVCFDSEAPKTRAFDIKKRRKLWGADLGGRTMLVEIIERLIAKKDILIMDEKKKSNETTSKDSKSLALLSPNTPVTRALTGSSIFLTPPDSGCCSLQKRPPFVPVKSDAILLDFGHEFNEEYKFDILGHLYDRSVHTVFTTIFGYLDDTSLLRASLVCKKWRNIIYSIENTSKSRLSDFISKKRKYCEDKGKENVGVQKMSYDLAQPILETTPSSASKVSRKDNSYQKYRQCPKCNSRAKVFDTHQSTCEKCNETFCIDCFRTIDTHDASLCSSFNTDEYVTPKRRKVNKDTIGSKKSKDRLRRLALKKR